MLKFRLLLLCFVLSACQQEHGPDDVKTIAYHCGNDVVANVTYANEQAMLEYQGKTHYLTQVISASGARYRNDEVEWWSKGEAATLFTDDDGNAGAILDECTVSS